MDCAHVDREGGRGGAAVDRQVLGQPRHREDELIDDRDRLSNEFRSPGRDVFGCGRALLGDLEKFL